MMKCDLSKVVLETDRSHTSSRVEKLIMVFVFVSPTSGMALWIAMSVCRLVIHFGPD